MLIDKAPLDIAIYPSWLHKALWENYSFGGFFRTPADGGECYRGHLEDSISSLWTPEPHGGAEWDRDRKQAPDRRQEG